MRTASGRSSGCGKVCRVPYVIGVSPSSVTVAAVWTVVCVHSRRLKVNATRQLGRRWRGLQRSLVHSCFSAPSCQSVGHLSGRIHTSRPDPCDTPLAWGPNRSQRVRMTMFDRSGNALPSDAGDMKPRGAVVRRPDRQLSASGLWSRWVGVAVRRCAVSHIGGGREGTKPRVG